MLFKRVPLSILVNSAQGVCVLMVSLVGQWVSGLVGAGAFRRVELAEDVELVERCERHEDEIPDEEDDSELLVQLPAVEVAAEDEEDHRREQAEG